MLAKLAMPAALSGVAMAIYLLVRPYGDHSDDPAAVASALADPRWIVAHVFGVLAIAQFARLAWRVHDVAPSKVSSALRTTGLAGLVLVLPYYGTETFSLHDIGRRELASPSPATLDLVAQVRDATFPLAMFATGLLTLSAAGVLFVLAWRAAGGLVRYVLPLGIAVTLFPAQFFAPDALRIAYGIAYAVCAGWLVLHLAAVASAQAGAEQG